MTLPTLDWSPFDRTNAIGDPGRQPEIKSVSGPLNVGVPDTALDFLSLETVEIRGCSTRGWSHRYKGTPRQDSFTLLTAENWLIAAVADGVSEGDFSQVAAETAARSACKLVADQLAKGGGVDWQQVARRISMRIIEEGEYRQIVRLETEDPTIDDRLRACLAKMSTTLIVAIVDMTPTVDGFAAEIGVVAGDSAAYVLPLDSTQLIPAGGGKTAAGPITSTRVRPLPGPVDPETVQLYLRPGDALFIGSDGIGDPVGDGSGEVGQELARRWAAPPSIDRFLLDVNSYRRSYDDDRTAVGIWARPEITLPEPEIAEPAQVEQDEQTSADASGATAEESGVREADPAAHNATSPAAATSAGYTDADGLGHHGIPPAPGEDDDRPDRQATGADEEPESSADHSDLLAVFDAVTSPLGAEGAAPVEPLAEAIDSDPTEPAFRATEFPKES